MNARTTAATPAPWTVHGRAIYSGKTYIAQAWADNDKEIPECYDMLTGIPVPDNDNEGAANALLMAAAPQLLEVLQELLSCCELNMDDMETSTWGMIRRANNAIAAATGASQS